MKKILAIIVMLMSSALCRADDLDIGEIIFDHVLDSYEWHITDWKGKPVAIHLPVILFDHGLKTFNSHKILETGSYGNYHIAAKGEPHEGKIVRADGSKPFDISITKNVLQLMMNALLLLVIVLLSPAGTAGTTPSRSIPRASRP